MPSAEHSVTIARPVGEVFAYVLGGTNATAWRPSVSDIKKVTLGPDRAGTRYEQGMKGGPGGRIAADYELTDLVPNRVIGFKVVAGRAGRLTSPSVVGHRVPLVSSRGSSVR